MSRELDRLRQQALQGMRKFDRAKQLAAENAEQTEDHLSKVQNEYGRVTDLSRRAPMVIEDIDRQFKEKTKLTNSDIALLFICTGIQCARQYLLPNDKLRLSDVGGVSSSVHGDRLMQTVYDGTVGQVAPPDWKDVLFQSVPYDATQQVGGHVTNTGLSGATHRYRTLGHDPILGWLFGTANIMTNSLTKTDVITTYQVKDMILIRHYPNGTLGMLSRAAQYAQNAPRLLGAAVARQAIHFGTDYFTKQGLPIPVISTVSPDVAKILITKGHINMWSVTRGATLSAMINQLIATIHRLFYEENRDGCEAMYEVRTRKILSYSNAIASGSNVIVSAFTKDLNKLDVGGMLVTIHRLISDAKFINEIKRDFLKNEIYKQIVGTPYDFMEGK